jgi:hypothetical protein
MAIAELEPGSFRDRQGRVFYREGRVLRALSAVALEDWQALSHTAFFEQAQADGRVISTRQVDDASEALEGLDGSWAAVLEHDRVPFVSYPFEWSFSMLRDAALLHLELLQEALNEDLILKDSSAYNVQWIGSSPVHIDIPSFERWQPGQPWVGYRQFCQLFLYPLFLTAYRDLPFHPWLRGSLDGITPQECRQLMSARDHFRAGVMTHVFLQSKLLDATADHASNFRAELKDAGLGKQLILRNVKGLQKVISKLAWKQQSSEWSSYSEDNSYTVEHEEAKRRFVGEAVHSRRWKMVWDLGCNTGSYSRIAAESADSVVAIDADHLSVERFYTELRSEGNDRILPLVMNLADASPNLGWRGLERRALNERGSVDLLLCLALIHHLVISANIPLSEFVAWLAEFNSWIVIEFPTKDDEMVKRLLLMKEDIYDDYSIDAFEHHLAKYFRVVRSQRLCGGNRHLYFLAPNQDDGPHATINATT